MTPTPLAVLASIPSPSSNSIEIGPLRLNAYGLMIALGVLAAVWLAGRRIEQKGVGTREDIAAIALWAVPAGVIGARLYHVITDWHRFDDAPLDAFKIWEGGLGIPGGMAVGVAVGVWVGHRRGIPLDQGLAAVVPALPLAQAIGRWGNWWNQELFGEPTDLPWALEVSPEKAIEAGYPPGTTFHPTFLYESLWNLGLCGVLIWIDKRFSPRGWQLLACYVMGYAFGRFWIERLRIDEATQIGGWRVNEIVSLSLFFGAALALVIGTELERRRLAGAGASAPGEAASGEARPTPDDEPGGAPHDEPGSTVDEELGSTTGEPATEEAKAAEPGEDEPGAERPAEETTAGEETAAGEESAAGEETAQEHEV